MILCKRKEIPGAKWSEWNLFCMGLWNHIGYGNPLDVLHDLALVAVTEQGFCLFLEFGFGQPFQSAFRAARLTARPHLSSLRPSVTLTLAAAGGAVHFVGEGIS